MQKPCETVKLLHSVFKVYWWLEFNGDFYLGLLHNNNDANNNNNNIMIMATATLIIIAIGILIIWYLILFYIFSGLVWKNNV